MYLSHLFVNVGDNPDRPRPGRLWLRNIYHVHQRLSMAFPSRVLKERDPLFLQPFDPQTSERPHFLFRIDRGVGDRTVRTMILVQSEQAPDWQYAFQNMAEILAAPPQTLTYNWNGQNGDRYRFRLLANPTAKRNGKRHPHWTEDEQRAWLQRKGEQHGFSVNTNALQIQVNGFKQGRKLEFGDTDVTHTHNLRFAAVQFDGVLRVTDRSRFEAALRTGIGSGKAFGFGLLTVVPANMD